MKLCIFCGNKNETWAPFYRVGCYLKFRRGRNVLD